MGDRLGLVGVVLLVLGAVLQLVPQIMRQLDALAWPGVLVLVAGAACLVVAAQRTGSERPAGALLPADPVRTLLRRVCLLAAPLVLVSIEIFHPLGFTDEVYAVLSRPGPFYFGPW